MASPDTTHLKPAVDGKIVVGVADLAVTDDPTTSLITYALGSCIGVTIYDPAARVGGMLHFMLPSSKVNPEKDRQTVMQIHKWLESADNQGGFRPVGEWVVAERLLVYRGEYISRRLKCEVPEWKATREEFILASESATTARKKETGITVDFNQAGNDAILVDFEGGEVAVDRVVRRTEEKVETKRFKDQAATEIVRAGHRLKKAREQRSLAKLELQKARAVLNRCSIKSPISGVVVERFVSPGEYVYNQPLLRVVQIDPLQVGVIVPAQMFGRIIPGMTATIVPELQEYGEHTATVTIVDKVIDAASSTFGVRLELPNAEQKIPSGLRCLVRFEIDQNADEVSKLTTRILPGQARN